MKNLVDYSSSETSDEEKAEPPIENSCKKLPRPFPVQRNECSNIKDCPEDHQMRSRTFEHIEGNWATHVYIDCPLNDNLTQAIRRIVDSYSDLHLIEPTHASLSKTFVLKFHWIENFFKSLREKFKTSSTKFLLELSSDVVYLSNDEGTRYFACILASEWCNSILSSIIENVDSGMREFNLPLYYENPSFHVSVIWKLTEFTEEEKSEISLKVKLLMEKHNEVSNLWVDAISVKSGNKLIRIPI